MREGKNKCEGKVPRFSACGSSPIMGLCNQKQDAVGDGRLQPDAATWRTGCNIRVVFDPGPFAPLCENTTTLTTPEAHKILHCRQRRTEPRPQVTCTENLVKFGRVVF